VNAFLASPNWRTGAIFVVYDEWGGFWDHVRPPSVPDDLASTNIANDFGLMGYRIPAVVLSPWIPRAQVSHLQCGFESIIKMITGAFNLGDLRTRDANANNIGLSFDFAGTPDFDVPTLPDPVAVASRPCSIGGGDVIDGSLSHTNDLSALEGLATKFGFPVGSGDASEIFSSPDSVKQALG